MQSYHRVHVHLGKKDRKQIAGMLNKGRESARVLRRASILRQLDQGQTAAEVADNAGVAPKTVRAIARRWEEEGLGQALYEKQRPGKRRRLDARQSQRIIAMVCGPPPEGRARWSVRLVTQEAVKRKLVPRVGRETIRIRLASHDLKPWREKSWCVAGLDEEYICRREDGLALYEKPVSEEEPVVCIDEKPVVLHADLRPPIPMQPGRMLRRDCEYKRCGTANTFCGVEPQKGRPEVWLQKKPHHAVRDLAFCTGILDFRKKYPEASDTDWVVDLVQGDAEIQLSQHAGDGPFECAVNLLVKDVDALFRKYVERGLDTTGQRRFAGASWPP
jgi:transposase